MRKAAAAILAAKRPVIYAGTGVQWAEAWPQLRAFAELLGAPVTTSLGGKSSFPENHPLSLGSGGNAVPKPVHHFVQNADLIIGIGCSFTETNFGIKFPKGKKIIHATLDPNHLNKDVVATVGLVGDAALTLEALIGELKQSIKSNRDTKDVVTEITKVREEWMEQWRPLLNSNEAPISPYRVIWELMAGTDPTNTIITHDAGSPRDQISPFWVSTEPMSYIGWGKTTQLGMGLGLAMGAKLVHPDKTCINFWGDAAIGFTGMDFETAVRERIPILSCLMNNFSMAIELKVMPISTDKYRSTDISGNYADMAQGVRRLWRARDRSEPDQGGDPARHRADEGGQAGAAGVHHREGNAGFQVLTSAPLPRFARERPGEGDRSVVAPPLTLASPSKWDGGAERDVQATMATVSIRNVRKRFGSTESCTASASKSTMATSSSSSAPRAAASPPCCA